MRKDNASFITKFISEAGSYLVNSDYFAFVELKDYACYVIADGIDIDERKESAKLAITTVITKFSENPGMSTGKLKQYMKAAHQALLDEAEEIRLEVSIAIVLTDYKSAMWAHAGNCRLYWMRNGSIRIATKDTSLTQKMVDEEEIPIDQLAYHEERNNLYSYLGQPGRFSPVISNKKKLEDGDILILMTRGVWENVGEAELIDSIDGVSKAEDVCTGLEDVILSQRLDVIENYTIASVFVDKIYKNPNAGKYKKWIKIGVSIGVVLLTLLLTLTITRIQKNKTNVEKMEKYKVRGIEYLEENNYSSADEQFNEAYTISENVKAGKSSKNYTKVMCVEIYEKLSDNLNRGMIAIQEGEYKKAAGLFKTAAQLSEELKAEYEENTNLYEDGIETYQAYAEHMCTAIEAQDTGDYQTAIDNFNEAMLLMKAVDDTANRNVANDLKNKNYAKQAISEGIAFEEQGDELRDNNKYSEAEKRYDSAKKMYIIAKDQYGDTDAANKIVLVDAKINAVIEANNNRSVQEKEEEAYEYVTAANEEIYAGNYEVAEELLEKALKIFKQTQNQEMIIKVTEMIEECRFGPDKETADAHIMSALEALSEGNNASAISFLEQAKSIYESFDKEKTNELQKIIIKLSTMQVTQGAVPTT